jgi:hypothetical protein
VHASKLVAKVDSAAVQDGFDLYLHGFFLSADGDWAVVQQGMNGGIKTARRYHWLSENLESFVNAPHSAIEGETVGEIVNLTDARAEPSRTAQLQLLAHGPDTIARELATLRGRSDVPPPAQPDLPHLVLPDHHDVRPSDVDIGRLRGNIAAAAEAGPRDFAELLMVPGVGSRTVRALALVAEVMHGAPCRFADPARFSLAHGGKDRHPFPVPTKVYDRTIRILKDAVGQAKLGEPEKLAAIKRLDKQARLLERTEKDTTRLDDVLADERRNSHDYGGRSVFGWEAPMNKGNGVP